LSRSDSKCGFLLTILTQRQILSILERNGTENISS
jgi:hypothetical protein